MKNRLFVAILIIFVLTCATVCAALAQSPSMLGVKEGDNFTYSFEVIWRSADPNDIPPQMFSDLNKTVSIHVNVTSIGATIAYVNVTKTMRDGTHESMPGFVEVLSGRGVEAQVLIIAANLTAGEKAYPESDGPPASVESFTIDETVTRTYLGSAKTVNHYSERVVNATTGNYVDRNAYYEKETGILLEMTIEHYYADADETDSEHWKIVQFNSATAPPDGTDNGNGGDSTVDWSSWLVPIAIGAIIFVVAVLLVVIVIRRRKNTPEEEHPQAPSENPA